MKRKIITIISFLIILIFVLLPNNIQYIAARISTYIYIKNNYSEMNFKYKSFEYQQFFGEYSITYIDENSKTYNFMLTPKILPVIVMHDPIKGK